MRAIIVALALVLIATTTAFAADWTGKWEVHWQNGSAQMDLVQHGDVVTGKVPGYGYKVEAKAGLAAAQHGPDADTLTGKWTDGKHTDTFELTLSRTGDTFTGFMNVYQWVSGGLRNDLQNFRDVETSTPQKTFFNFIKYGNAWASGEAGADGEGESLVFMPNEDQMPQLQQVLSFRRLFRLVSQTTFNVNDIPDEAPSDTLTVTLAQAGTGTKLPLTLVRKNGNWLIQYPSEAELTADESALYKRSGGRPPPDDAFRQLRNPRDTMRTFLEAMDRWDQGGREHVERMLDLSDVPESSRAEEADLAAQYIRRDLQKLGLVQLLAISDDETSRDPFVYFRHPAGTIEIVPVAEGKGEPPTWKFSAATVRTANDLYSDIAAMPDRSIGHGHAAPPATPYFALRDWVASIAPSLLEPLGVVAKWQVIAGFALLALCFLAGIAPALIVGAVLRLAFGSALHNINQVRLPLILAFGTLLWQIFSPYIGLPREVRQVTVPLVGVVMTLSLLLVVCRLVDVFSYNYIAKAGKIGVDRIAFSLIMGVVRAALVAVAAANIADKLSIPYNGLLAGLGIGGLAFAFASRETLSNVFGAAILAADRPFKAGDWITVGEIDGDVEHVGIRSTRVRTLDDTVLIVPNGKLSDATITNHGTRRFRRAVGKLVLAYDTPVELIDRFRQEIMKLISETPGAMPDKTEVYVRGFALQGPELNITFLLDTSSWQVEWNTKHQVWTGVMALAKRLGVRFSEEERDRAIAGAAQRVFRPEAALAVESSAPFSAPSSQAA